MLTIKKQGRVNLHCLSVKSLIQFCYPVWTILFLKLVYMKQILVFEKDYCQLPSYPIHSLEEVP